MIYSVGDKIISKKAHACGGNEWQIVRTGADIKIKCLGCGNVIMLSRHNFEKSIKNIETK